MLKSQSNRIAVLVQELTPAKREVRLLPAGEFRAADGSGRPKDVPAWRLDAGLARALIARFNTRSDRRVIDYEHATVTAAANGGFAPAAGWFGRLGWREPAEGEPGGLYATDVEWTAQAAAMIDAKEYRYISPVFTYDKQGRVLDLLHAAITNTPGLDGLTDLAALSARFSFAPDQPDKETDMDLKQLLAALGLAEDKTEADALATVTALKAAADAADAQIAALKAQAPDPVKYVPAEAVKDLQTQVATLTAQIRDGQVDDLVAEGLADGRILPSMEGWARDLGKKDVAQLKSYLDNASPVAALKGSQSGGKGPGGRKEGELDDVQLAVCRQMGVEPEAYKATLQAAA